MAVAQRLPEPITPTTVGTAVVISPSHRVQLGVVDLDGAQAASWLARYHYERQRPEYPSAVRLYAGMMRRNEWRISTIMLCTYDGTPPQTAADTGEGPALEAGTFIINGRNRLTAVIESGTRQGFLIEHHHVSRPVDVHDLYMTQDRGRSRTPGDVYRAMALDEELGLSLHHLRMIGEAESYIQNGFNLRAQNQSIDPYRRAMFVRAWVNEGRAWIACLKGSRSAFINLLSASPVTAVALVILRHQPERAAHFLTDFAHDDGLTQGMPAKALHDWVIENRVRGMPNHHYARHVAGAWNAFYEDRPLERILVRNPDLPIRILGTPYVGKPDSAPAAKEAP